MQCAQSDDRPPHASFRPDQLTARPNGEKQPPAYSRTSGAEIEIRCTHMLADLWNAPAAAITVGTSTIGSSEACMLGGMAAKWRWKARRKAQGKPADKPNLVCGPVQVRVGARAHRRAREGHPGENPHDSDA